MKLKKASKIASLLTAGALLFTPKISHSLDGIIMNSITNQGIPNAIVKLYEGETLLDSTRTNEDGCYRVSTNDAAPEIILPNNDNYNIKVFDIHGRFLYNLDQSWNGRTIPNLPSGFYIFASQNKAIAMPVMEGSLLSPFNRNLAQRVSESKNSSRTSGADELYTLSVSDDGVQGRIGDYYDASIPITARDEDINSLEKNVELIPFYDMHDWNGDFLEYLKRAHETATFIWGDYPEHYPIHVDIDSVNCVRYTRGRAQEILNGIKNALDLWNQRSDLNLFTYENVNRNNSQVRIDYSENQGMPRFEFDYIRDEDRRYRLSSGVVYLRNDLLGDDYGIEIIKHEVGHATGWLGHSNNELSIMRPSAYSPYVNISEDDGYVVRTFTTLKNNTYWDTCLRE